MQLQKERLLDIGWLLSCETIVSITAPCGRDLSTRDFLSFVVQLLGSLAVSRNAESPKSNNQP